jgi:hypothetical protein
MYTLKVGLHGSKTCQIVSMHEQISGTSATKYGEITVNPQSIPTVIDVPRVSVQYDSHQYILPQS